MNELSGTLLRALDALPLFRYRVELTFGSRLELPGSRRALLWRGAFGSVFRSLVCHDLDLACDACPLRTSCPFPRAFAPSIPAGRPDILRMRDPPRPFVLGDPHPEAPSLPADTPVALGLALVGTAAADLPYFVVALRRLGEEGLGPTRARFVVDAVRCVDADGLPGAVVFERGAEVVRPARTALRARDLARPGDAAARRVRVRFVTPTDVRGKDAAPEEAPRFGTLVRRARDRAAALATFFGEGPLGGDLRAAGDAADAVELAGFEVRRAEVVRRSGRTGQRHPVGGVVGTAVYEGEGVAGAVPWLRVAEVVGVGKHATFGNGRIAVDVVG